MGSRIISEKCFLKKNAFVKKRPHYSRMTSRSIFGFIPCMTRRLIQNPSTSQTIITHPQQPSLSFPPKPPSPPNPMSASPSAPHALPLYPPLGHLFRYRPRSSTITKSRSHIIPPPFITQCRKCNAKNPSTRYPTMIPTRIPTHLPVLPVA